MKIKFGQTESDIKLMKSLSSSEFRFHYLWGKILVCFDFDVRTYQYNYLCVNQ